MGMGDVLVGGLAIVDDQVGALHAKTGTALSRQQAVEDLVQVLTHKGRQLFELLHMQQRDQQQVAFAQGVHVHEGHAVFIAVHQGRRQGAGDNLAKNTGHP